MIRRGRVLLVADGTSPHTRRFGTALAGAGFDVCLACFEHGEIDNLRVRRLGTGPPEDDLRYPAAIVPLAQLMRREQPQIVHAHYVSSYGLIAALASRLAHPRRRPFSLVQTAWGSDLLVTAAGSLVRRLAATYALRAADLVTGDSRDLEASARRLAPNVRYERFVFGPRRALLDATPRPEKVIVSARRLDPDTRVDRIVAAFGRARREAPEFLDGWRLVVAGTGRVEAEVRQAAGADPEIEFVGQLAGDALAELLLTAAIAVSIPVSDASSAAVLESMAAGLLLVVNDLPANREWLDSSTAEFVGRDPDEVELAAALIRATRRTSSPAAVRERITDVVWEDEIARMLAGYASISRRRISA